jgi:hypothetical protein
MTNFIKNFLKKHGYYLLLLAPPIVFIFFYFPTSLAYHADKINIGLKQLSLASREIKKDISDCRNNILLDNSQTQIDIDTLNQIAVKATKCGFLSPLTSITN